MPGLRLVDGKLDCLRAGTRTRELFGLGCVMGLTATVGGVMMLVLPILETSESAVWSLNVCKGANVTCCLGEGWIWSGTGAFVWTYGWCDLVSASPPLGHGSWCNLKSGDAFPAVLCGSSAHWLLVSLMLVVLLTV